MAIKKMSVEVGDGESVAMHFDEPQGARPYYKVRWPGAKWTSARAAGTLGDALEHAKMMYLNQQNQHSLREMSSQRRHLEIVAAMRGMGSRSIADLHQEIDAAFNRCMKERVSEIMSMHELNKTEQSYVGVLLSQHYLDAHKNSHHNIESKHQSMLVIEAPNMGGLGGIDSLKCTHAANEIIQLRDNQNGPIPDGSARPPQRKKGKKKKAVKKKAPKI